MQYKLQYYCSNASISSADFSAEPYKVSLQARSNTPAPVSRVDTTVTAAPEPVVPTDSHQSHYHHMDQGNTEKPSAPETEPYSPRYQAVSAGLKTGDQVKTNFDDYQDVAPVISRGKTRLFICPCLF